MSTRRVIRKKKKQKIFQEVDKVLLSLIFGFLLFGIVMIYNSTAIYAQDDLGNAYQLVFLQIGWIVLGFFGMLFFSKINLEFLKKISLPLFLIAVFFLSILALVSVTTSCSTNFIFSPCINGAHRWFYLNPSPLPAIPLLGVLGFQPSEFAKFALIIYLSVILDKTLSKKEDPFSIFLIITGLVSLLILLQPNMSTSALLFIIGISIYFAAGKNLTPLIVTIPILGISGIGFILSSAYRRARLLTLLSPGDSGELSLGYHIKQIQIALGSGGFFGLGFGQSRQKFKYLPEVSADSIFAIVGEEFGFIGTSLFVILFSYLIYKGYSIAKNSPDLLGRLLAVGVTTWFAGQFFINIAAMTRLIPLTGVPLPLVSYGGSSMIFSLMGMGILLNVSKK